ncbi:hypothetical protein L541_4353 [Bordetella hinzii CA90 BAL1384]|jgi:hypothetical protein|uniref:Uncharacterized protein n=1 Tax=Bordetella hinzii OH87 BAL007II TaxID=1331262 RepID=A0ABR4QYW9_9BORD|nr:hypothetical protein L544_2477 [Bordetella hinzii OH87 BAL007II]KCB25394.1 hypothetical protein L543_2727 [Bordetella hinzii L60]KCB34402.1 hypothetical protein L541_4353 [Bordetella hinzii CA90 BAL1384]KCB39533.1 hypothetical protein L539_2949 [Bordetella hinzii 5132]KCB41729.1 hypothetical protein L538_0656 [Bordetella hinzii 4161]
MFKDIAAITPEGTTAKPGRQNRKIKTDPPGNARHPQAACGDTRLYGDVRSL